MSIDRDCVIGPVYRHQETNTCFVSRVKCIVDITGEIAGYTMYMYMYIIRTCNVSDTLLSAV